MEYILRLLIAVVFGGVIGFEREIRGRQAGVRTQMLICLGACMSSVLCIFLLKDNFTGDIFRLSAAVICGIGFIQTGTIIKRDNGTSSGLTTAAVSWVTAIIGVILGFGYYKFALAAFIITMVISYGLYYIDKRVLKHSFNIYAEVQVSKDVQNLIDTIKSVDKKVKVSIVSPKTNSADTLALSIYINKPDNVNTIFEILRDDKNVKFIAKNDVQ